MTQRSGAVAALPVAAQTKSQVLAAPQVAAAQTKSQVMHVKKKPVTKPSVAAALTGPLVRAKRITIQPEMIRELLRNGALRLSPPGAWLQGSQSVMEDGELTQPESPDARQWDCLGALRLEALKMVGGGQFEGPARQLYVAAAERMAGALIEHLDCRRASRDAPTSVAAWNDSEERTQDEVLNLFALAACG